MFADVTVDILVGLCALHPTLIKAADRIFKNLEKGEIIKIL